MTALGFRAAASSDSLGFEKVRLWAYTQRLFSALDTLELCQFCFGPGLLYGISDIVELVNAATGWSTTLWEIMQVGERRINLMRMFNAREGFSSEDDDLPDRVFEPLRGGHTEGNRIDREEFKEAKRQYYEMMGWCPQTGIPTGLKLKELALEWVLEASDKIQ